MGEPYCGSVTLMEALAGAVEGLDLTAEQMNLRGDALHVRVEVSPGVSVVAHVPSICKSLADRLDEIYREREQRHAK